MSNKIAAIANMFSFIGPRRVVTTARLTFEKDEMLLRFMGEGIDRQFYFRVTKNPEGQWHNYVAGTWGDSLCLPAEDVSVAEELEKVITEFEKLLGSDT